MASAAAAASPAKRWSLPAYGSPTGLELVEVSLPIIAKPGEAVLEVLTTTASASDLVYLSGFLPMRQPLPCTPGFDVVGRVVSVGAGVTSLAVGDTVVGMPGHSCMATKVVLQAAKLLKIPPSTDPEQLVGVALAGARRQRCSVASSRGGRLRAPDTQPLDPSERFSWNSDFH